MYSAKYIKARPFIEGYNFLESFPKANQSYTYLFFYSLSFYSGFFFLLSNRHIDEY